MLNVCGPTLGDAAIRREMARSPLLASCVGHQAGAGDDAQGDEMRSFESFLLHFGIITFAWMALGRHAPTIALSVSRLTSGQQLSSPSASLVSLHTTHVDESCETPHYAAHTAPSPALPATASW